MADRVTASKFLSLILRHKPSEIGLVLDGDGWAEIEDVVRLSASGKLSLTRALIEEITATSDKNRFVISSDGERIRANQGHSIEVDLGLTPKVPPETLYHGTAERFVKSIQQQGLVKGARQHVHLSLDRETAERVGARRGKPIVFAVRAGQMHRLSHVFFLSENGVWLTDLVPPQFLGSPA